MILPIYVYGSAVLRSKCQEITEGSEQLTELIQNMFDTMYDAEGVGLAAPQVGKSLRLFVVDGTSFADEEPEMATFKKVFINPEIYEFFGNDAPFSEGCLSLPGIREDVMRPTGVKIKYLDENFVEQDVTFTGTSARIVQHEYDHLQEHVFTDRLSPLRRNLIKKKLLKISKGDYRATYRTKMVKGSSNNSL